MGVLEPSPQTKPKSRRTSTAPRSSGRSSRQPSEPSEHLAALQAKLEELRAAGESDRAAMQTLRDEIADLKLMLNQPVPKVSNQTEQGRSFREFFGGTV